MIHTVKAIYSNGLLTPLEPLPLKEQERVRITVQSLEDEPDGDREDSVRRFVDGARASRFCSQGSYPTRDQLHERHQS